MSNSYTFTIEVYTSVLVITGSYDLPIYRRVSDALNSRMHRYLALRDASVAPIGRPQHVQHVPQILVNWSNALLVATLSEPQPPTGFTPPAIARDTQSMMFFTDAFALRADFYKRTDRELVELLADMTDDFIPLTHVSIYSHQGGSALNRSFVCLNRHYIQALYAVGAQIANAPLPAWLDRERPQLAVLRPTPPPPPEASPSGKSGEDRPRDGGKSTKPERH